MRDAREATGIDRQVSGTGMKHHEQKVCSGTLARLAAISGSGHLIVAPDLGRNEPVLSGRMLTLECRSGLRVHASDACELHDLTTQITLKPCVSIFVVLDGALDAAFAEKPMRLAAPQNGAAGQIWAKTERTPLVRRSRRGAHVRKIAISAPLDWFDGDSFGDRAAGAAIRGFAATHLSTISWSPSLTVCALAAQILGAAATPDWRRELEIESRAIGIAAEAMAAVAGTAQSETVPRRDPQGSQRAQRARDYIEAHLHDALSLDLISREAGASVAALQRAFKLTYNTSVIEFVRRRRLDAARIALEEEGVSVGEAAYRAGYSTSAAFSTAFKREFGVSPALLRR